MSKYKTHEWYFYVLFMKRNSMLLMTKCIFQLNTKICEKMERNSITQIKNDIEIPMKSR